MTSEQKSTGVVFVAWGWVARDKNGRRLRVVDDLANSQYLSLPESAFNQTGTLIWLPDPPKRRRASR